MSRKIKKEEKVFKLPKAGTQEARILRIIDLGTQKPRNNDVYGKGPKEKVSIVFELADDKIVDKDGIELPMVLSKEFTLSLHKKSALTELLKMTQTEPGDTVSSLSALLGKPVNVLITITSKDDKSYANISKISGVSAKVAATLPPLVADSFLFDYENPNPELLSKLGNYIIGVLKRAEEYEGSKLQKMLEESPIA